MAICCPNCSAAALGAETASICTECATATVAGASFSLPMMLAAAVGAAVLVLSLQAIRRMRHRMPGVAPTPA